MTNSLLWTDQLRIERVIWTFDHHLQDLPWRSRTARRRELRGNLYDAAADVGTATALRRLGSVRRLAAEYLAAEYGESQPRPAWSAGAVFLLAAVVFLTWFHDAGAAGYRAGVLAADPHATGTFHWSAVGYVFDGMTFTFADGKSTSTLGGAFTPVDYLGLAVGTVLFGRLWRALPERRRRSRAADQE
ncbi:MULTISPECIES: hypothetical protein [unclassified Streptomyces]|uniref:hypothetical protein n=1 Tax=unclassified Streptomyces TaxID=2593676 RepID=UPI002DD8CA13|nr:hypothetical protein [Streptomyces sp. NBC_01750]WSB05070.1 hypothetical protein OIE54_41250 [Streptomyces sp. NBC_01794]WSD30644.1 hypothetical protein OG966_00790 [Streptomyces sp. NBC_01750]